MKLRLDRLFKPTKFQRKLQSWQIANWTAEEMKGGRDGGRAHSLPIPPEALKVMKHFHKEAGGDSPWMFAARTPHKHVSKSALNQLIYRLQGRVYDHAVRQKPHRKGKPGPKPRPMNTRPNLFEQFGIRPWTPQDCRRTITTFLDDRRLGGAASAILGHKMPNSHADERERLARVTEQHYNGISKDQFEGRRHASLGKSAACCLREGAQKASKPPDSAACGFTAFRHPLRHDVLECASLNEA